MKTECDPSIEDCSIKKQYTVNDVMDLVNFEGWLKSQSSIKEFLEISPSVPNGLNMDCTAVNADDFSTIIC